MGVERHLVRLRREYGTHQGETAKGLHYGIEKNRLVALSEADSKAKRYTRLDQLVWTEQKAVTGYLKGLTFPVKLARQIFTNKDGSSGICGVCQIPCTHR